MNPCEQQDNIVNISKTLDRMEKTQDRLVDLLEKVAKQDARLNHLEEHSERSYNEMDGLYTRMREVELNQAAYGPAARDKFYELVNEMNEKIEDVNKRIEIFYTKISPVTRFYKITTQKYALYTYAVIFGIIGLGFISDLFNHSEWLKSIWFFYRGK